MMKPTISLDRTLVAVETDHTLHAMVELRAPAAPTNAERTPLDLVLVIDRSGSMNGDPLEAVKASATQLLRVLGPQDRCAVVSFDDHVELVLPLEHHDANAAAIAVAAIKCGGSTNLSGGWLKGVELLEHPRADALSRIVLLTDGQANAGITDAERLQGLAISAAGRRITTSTIGYGEHFDENLLSAMASGGQGNTYWCAGPDEAPRIFDAEFVGLASVVAQNVSVEIRPTDAAVNAVFVLNDFPTVAVEGGVQVMVGDAYGDEVRRVVFKLHIPHLVSLGPATVGEVVLRWAGVGSEVSLHTVTIPMAVNAVPAPDAAMAAPDPQVTEHVLLLEAARARKHAREAAERGDFGAASLHLATSAFAMRAAPPSAALEADVSELEADAAAMAEGHYDQATAKRLWSRQQASGSGRKTRFDDDASTLGEESSA